MRNEVVLATPEDLVKNEIRVGELAGVDVLGSAGSRVSWIPEGKDQHPIGSEITRLSDKIDMDSRVPAFPMSGRKGLFPDPSAAMNLNLGAPTAGAG